MSGGRWPLALQLALGFVLVTALALGGGGALLLRQIQARQISDRSRSLVAQANAAANLVAELQSDGAQRDLELALYRFHQQTGVRLVVADGNGVVVADSVTPSPLAQQRLTHPELAAALGGRQATGTRWLEAGGWVMYGAVPVWHERAVTGAVLLSADINAIDAAGRELGRRLWQVAAAAGALAVLLGVGLARYLARPLERLAVAAEELARGRLEARVQPGGSREVGHLGGSFNAMAAELGRLDRQRRAFVADASHELRTPVAAIRALADSLLTDTTGDVSLYKEYLADITRECDRASRLVDRLLELARLDLRQERRAREQASQPEPFDLSALAGGVVHALQPLARERGVGLELGAPAALPVRADPQLVETALGNLVENALKYTPAGGQARVEISAGPGAALVAVSDTGSGIPPEHLPHIFERFYRVDKARARATGGAGLGLSVAAQAAALLGGRIDVESEPGRGSRFTLVVPM